MPSPESPVEIAQQLLYGKWMHSPAALRACQRGEWAGFARELASADAGLGRRSDYERCLALAVRPPVGPVVTSLTLVPLWACSTEDNQSNEWVAVHGLAQEGKPLGVLETGPFMDGEDASPRADALWECTVRRWTAATVVQSRFYAPEIPLLLRAGEFGVLESQVDEVLSVHVRETGLLPRPTRELPMYASWYEPRVKVSPELESQIRALSFTAGDNGEEPLAQMSPAVGPQAAPAGHPKAARLRRLAIGLFIATVPGLGLVFLYANQRDEVPNALCAGPVSLVWVACIPMFVGNALWTLSSLKGSEPPRRPWIMLIFNLLLWGGVMGGSQRCLF